MELKYKEQPGNEAGSALPGCGVIYISEIRPTLVKLSKDLDFSFDLNNYTIGSTGKKEYSGDIDIVLDDKMWQLGPKSLKESLDKIFGKNCVKLNGSMVHLKYPIVDFDGTKQKRHPRTGYVQIDFNFGDVDWERFYHFSPGETSSYKGAHRNLAIAAISYMLGRVESSEKDSYDRPVWEIRFKWSPKGFLKVKRSSQKDPRTGAWMKKRVDEILYGPVFSPEKIAEILFPVAGTVSDLESLETIVEAVKRNYNIEDQHRIWQRIAKNFADWKEGKLFEYPDEIGQYLPSNDK
jgi:hypothetical protein